LGQPTPVAGWVGLLEGRGHSNGCWSIRSKNSQSSRFLVKNYPLLSLFGQQKFFWGRGVFSVKICLKLI